MFNFEQAIFESAEILKQENNLLASTEEITCLIADWIEEQLQEIEWNYQNSSSLKRKIFNLELKTEKELLETEELAA